MIDGTWSVDALSRCFGCFLVDRILLFSLSGYPGDDCWFWSTNPRGLAKPKDAYSYLRGDVLSPSVDRKAWRFLWKLVLPPKIKEISFFLMAFFYCVGILSLLRPVVSASHRTTLLCMLYSGVLTLFKFGACLLVPFQRLGSWDVRPLIGTNPFLKLERIPIWLLSWQFLCGCCGGIGIYSSMKNLTMQPPHCGLRACRWRSTYKLTGTSLRGVFL